MFQLKEWGPEDSQRQADEGVTFATCKSTGVRKGNGNWSPWNMWEQSGALTSHFSEHRRVGELLNYHCFWFHKAWVNFNTITTQVSSISIPKEKLIKQGSTLVSCWRHQSPNMPSQLLLMVTFSLTESWDMDNSQQVRQIRRRFPLQTRCHSWLALPGQPAWSHFSVRSLWLPQLVLHAQIRNHFLHKFSWSLPYGSTLS